MRPVEAILREGSLRFGIGDRDLVAVVNVSCQRMVLFSAGRPIADLPVSTAAAGVDAREGSGGTPPGWHRMCEIIGLDAAPGTVFRSRQPTGARLTAEQCRDGEGDAILTRIFWLSGLESGVNAGPGVDSKARYIYIHGTNAEERIGTPCSHGCIRVTNRDAVGLARVVADCPGDFYVFVDATV